MSRKILSRLFYVYLRCLERTVHVSWEGEEAFDGNQVVGFWHEDSFAMNLLLKEVTKEKYKMSVLVTGDPRGDYIQYIIDKCRGDAVRIGYGFCDTGTLRELLSSLKEENRSVAIAMDGPLGPRYIPKKMTYFLSEKGEVSLVGITVKYSAKLVAKNRWDHYKIPLPFTKITFHLHNYGVVSCKCPPDIRGYEESLKCSIIKNNVCAPCIKKQV